MKQLIILVGACGVGKTTTRKAMIAAGDQPECFVFEDDAGDPQFHFTLYKDFAVAGNHNSGTDANCGPQKCIDSARQCFEQRDVVVLDGLMQSPRWTEIINEQADFALVFWFDFTVEQIEERLLKRRTANGHPEPLSEKLRANVVSKKKQSDKFIWHVKDKCPLDKYSIHPVTFNYSPREVAQQVWDAIEFRED